MLRIIPPRFDRGSRLVLAPLGPFLRVWKKTSTRRPLLARNGNFWAQNNRFWPQGPAGRISRAFGPGNARILRAFGPENAARRALRPETVISGPRNYHFWPEGACGSKFTGPPLAAPYRSARRADYCRRGGVVSGPRPGPRFRSDRHKCGIVPPRFGRGVGRSSHPLGPSYLLGIVPPHLVGRVGWSSGKSFGFAIPRTRTIGLVG